MRRVGAVRARTGKAVFAAIAAAGMIIGLAMPAAAASDAPADGTAVSSQTDATPTPSATDPSQTGPVDSTPGAPTPSASASGAPVTEAPSTPAPGPTGTDAPTVPDVTTPELGLTVTTPPPAAGDTLAGASPLAAAPGDASSAAAVSPPTLYTPDGQRELTGTPGETGKVTVTGRITDAATGSPLAGVVITGSTDGGGGGWGFVARVATPTDGGVIATSTASGLFTIVLDSTWATLSIDADPATGRQGFHAALDGLVLGQSYSVGDFAVAQGAVLSGSVTLPPAPAAELTAQVRVYSGSETYSSEWVSATGAPGASAPWSIVVAPGTYSVQFSDGGTYAPQWWNGASDRAGATPITVAAGDRRTGIDGALALGANTVSGTVTSASGAPIAGASVNLYDPDGPSTSQWVGTDSSGRYVIGNIAPGKYVLSVQPAWGSGLRTFYGGGDDAATATRIVISSGTSTNRTGVDVTVIPGAVVTGTFTAEAAATITAVHLQTPDGVGVNYASVTGGTFSFRDIRAGSYRLAAAIGDAVIPFGDVFAVGTGEQVTVDVSGFTPVHSATLTVTVPPADPDSWSSRPVALIDPSTHAEIARKYVYGTASGVDFTVPAGSYLVQYSPPNGAPIYYPSATTVSGATAVELAPDAAVEIAFAAGTGSIHGVVTAAGSPAAGLTVELYRAHNLNSPISTTTTAADGSYAFSELGVENFAVRVFPSGTLYVPRWFGPSGTRDDATAITLDKDETFDSADVELVLGGAAEGSVTGDDLSSDHLYLYLYLYPDGGGEQLYAVSTPAADGSLTWSVNGAAAGTYTISAWLGNTALIGPASVTIVAGETATGLDFAQPAPQIRGTVTSAATGAAVAADVVAEPVDSSTYHRTVYTTTAWSTGAYTLRGLDVGVAYRVRVSASSSSANLATQWWKGAATAAEATPIVAPSAGEPPVQADVALGAGIVIAGRVIDSVSGSGVSGVWVSNGSFSTTTGTLGDFSFSVSAPGPVTISTSSNKTYVSSSNAVTVPAEGLTGVEIQLTRGYTISGTVTARNNGVPLSNVWVGTNPAASTGSGWSSASTLTDGTYTTNALAPGDYVVSYDNDSGLYVSQYYDGAPNADTAQVVRIIDAPVTGVDAQLSLGGVVRGKVRDATGAPVAWATVGVATAPSSGTATAILGIEVSTSADGSFTLPALDPGDYTLYVYTGDYRTFWYSGKGTRDTADIITIRAGVTTVVDAELSPLGEGERALTPEQSLSSAFAIVRQPQDVAVPRGATAVFSAVASGSPVPDVQWQENDGRGWADLPGETGTQLYIPGVAAGLDGTRYRAVFTQGDATLTSDAAELSIVAEPVAPDAPAAPTVSDVTATGAKISWTAPAGDGGASVSGYRLEIFRAGEAEPVRTIELGATGSQTVGGLDEDTAYEVEVSARNRVGLGEASPRATFQTSAIAVPGAPTGVVARATGQTSVAVSWVAPTVDGGSAITGYDVRVLRDGAPVTGASVTVTGLTAAITGLEASVTYDISVAAVNAKGAGPAGAIQSVTTDATPPQVTVPGVPGVPSGLALSSTSVALNWTAPATDGGTPVDGYSVRVYADGVELPGLAQLTTGTSAEITGLAASNAYTFAVAARNAIGFGDYSAQSTPVLTLEDTPAPVVPGSPGDVTVAAVTETGATITWSAPSADGGAAVTSYDVTVTRDGAQVPAVVTVSGTTATITGLTAGSDYEIAVAARNIVGAGVPATVALTTEAAAGPGEPTEDPTPTDANRGDITVTPDEVQVGGALTVTGLAPLTTYRVWFFSEPFASGYATTDESGAVTVIVPVLPLGAHRILFHERESGTVAGWAWFEVIPTPAEPGGGSGPTGGTTADPGSRASGSGAQAGGVRTLERTGGDVDLAPWGLAGGLLVLSGIALILIHRRRVNAAGR